MHPAITKLEKSHRKPALPQVKSGDTVRVHQLIREGSKQRIQTFEGVVIRTARLGSVSASITVRRIASGIGVEKAFLLNSPNTDKVEVLRRGKTRRNFLGYLRDRRGKSARLKEVSFDRDAVNVTTVKNDVSEDPLADQEDEQATELDTEEQQQVEADVSTDEIAKDENREAAADEASPNDGDGDESEVERAEAERGVEKAEPNKQ